MGKLKEFYKKTIINELPIEGLSRLLVQDKTSIVMQKNKKAKKDSFNYKFFACLNIKKMSQDGKCEKITEFIGLDENIYSSFRVQVVINNFIFTYYAGNFFIKASHINTLDSGDMKKAFLIFISRYANKTITFYENTIYDNREQRIRKLKDNIDLRINKNFKKSELEIYSTIKKQEVDYIVRELNLSKDKNAYYNKNKTICLYNENTIRNIGEIDSYKLEFRYNDASIKNNKELSKLTAYQLFNNKKVLNALRNSQRISKVLKLILEGSGGEKMIADVTSKDSLKVKRKKPENTEELLLFTYEIAENTARRVDDLEKWRETVEKRLRDIELMRKN